MDIKKLRKEKGMSQVEVAKQVGASPNSVRSWEYGVIEPNDENKKKLEELFGVKWEEEN